MKLLILIYFVSNIGTTIIFGSMFLNGNADIDDLFNPFAIHELFNVNWFGTFAILVFDIIFMTPLAIVYFIYKLCTIGRKDD